MEARPARPLAAAAWAGLLHGASALAGCGTEVPPAVVVEIAPAPPAPAESAEPAPPRPLRVARPPRHVGCKNACKGMNECKGKGGCKTERNGCKGMNDCKGQGGCRSGDCP